MFLIVQLQKDNFNKKKKKLLLQFSRNSKITR